MISDEERRLIPLVSKNGCVDLKILRRALRHARTLVPYGSNEAMFRRLFVSLYLKGSDPHGDAIMEDAFQ
jgi:hypothetical protein